MYPRLCHFLLIAAVWLLPPRIGRGRPHPLPPVAPRCRAVIPVAPVHVATQMVYKATPTQWQELQKHYRFPQQQFQKHI